MLWAVVTRALITTPIAGDKPTSLKLSPFSSKDGLRICNVEPKFCLNKNPTAHLARRYHNKTSSVCNRVEICLFQIRWDPGSEI